MFTIRVEQQEAFDRALFRGFEDDMVSHLRRFAPRLFELRGEPTFRALIRLGADRAGRYGFTNRGPVRLFVELMVILGCDFDTDPMLPWAARDLSESPSYDQMSRAH